MTRPTAFPPSPSSAFTSLRASGRARFVALALALGVASPLVACDTKAKKDKSSEEDDDKKDKDEKSGKKDKKEKGTAASSAESNLIAGGSATAAPTSAPAAATAGKYPDIDKLLGSKAKWTPSVFEKLKSEMKPEEAAKVFPGMDKRDELGFTKIDVKDNPGLWRYEFLYLGEDRDKLASAEIHFDPKLTSDEFWNTLLTAMKKKYGEKYETISTRSLMWMSENIDTAELSEDTDFESDDVRTFFVIKVML